MVKSLNILVVLRILIGLFFVLVSVHKLLSPYQNFLYVIENYQLFPPALEKLAALAMPWVEFLLGAFLALGLWLRYVLPGFMLMVCSFLVIVGQAILRRLPIDSCGCFGDLMPMTLKQIFLFDTTLFLIFAAMLMSLEKTSRWGLDRLFKNEP